MIGVTNYGVVFIVAVDSGGASLIDIEKHFFHIIYIHIISSYSTEPANNLQITTTIVTFTKELIIRIPKS